MQFDEQNNHESTPMPTPSTNGLVAGAAQGWDAVGDAGCKQLLSLVRVPATPNGGRARRARPDVTDRARDADWHAQRRPSDLIWRQVRPQEMSRRLAETMFTPERHAARLERVARMADAISIAQPLDHAPTNQPQGRRLAGNGATPATVKGTPPACRS